MTTLQNIEQNFRAIEGVVAVNTLYDLGVANISVEWVGRDRSWVYNEVLRVAKDSVAAGVIWTVHVYTWRWHWLRRIDWPATYFARIEVIRPPVIERFNGGRPVSTTPESLMCAACHASLDVTAGSLDAAWSAHRAMCPRRADS